MGERLRDNPWLVGVVGGATGAVIAGIILRCLPERISLSGHYEAILIAVSAVLIAAAFYILAISRKPLPPDDDQPEPPRPAKDIWNIPHDPNPHFTGREALLDELRGMLVSGERAALTAIQGMGGVGKTQIALEYAHRHRADYEAVWWVRAEEPAALAADYAALAGALDLPEKDAADQRVAIAAVRGWLCRNDGWLLVFDNAPNPPSLTGYTPAGAPGHVIVTSRHHDWSGVAEPLEVNLWTTDECIEFLKRRTGEDDEEAAASLAGKLDRLPLALEQAAGYIRSTGGALSIPGYCELFEERHADLLARGGPAGYTATVATTWEISDDRLVKESPEAADLLNLFAFLAPDDIPRTLLTEGAEHLPERLAAVVKDPLRLNDAIAAIMRFSLVTADAETFSLHRLVQEVVRERLAEKDRKKWASAAVCLLNAAFPRDSHDVRTWDTCRSLLPHALVAAGYAEAIGACPDESSALMNETGVHLSGRADLKEAKSLFERALVIAEAAHGPEDPNVATIANNLGGVLKALGDLKAAKRHFERALKIDEAAFGKDHPEVARDVNNLGSVLKALGDLEAAKGHVERALKIFTDFLGPDHPNTRVVRGNLERLEREIDGQAAGEGG